jgi:hypothetical protein
VNFLSDPVKPSSENNTFDPNFNLDIYTESDFDQYTPVFSNKFYYQQLLNAFNY